MFLLALLAAPLGAKPVKVILLGGQSNMFGYQTNPSELPTDLQGPQEDVLFYFGTNFLFLQPGSGMTFGSEISFGRTIADALPEERFLFIKHSDGGTSLWNQWNLSDGRSYNLLKEVVDFGLDALTNAGYDYEIVGMLWAQGERDAYNHRTTEEYQSDFTAFIADIRSRYGADLPFLFSRLSVQQTARDIDAVRAAQNYVAAADPHTYLIDADDFPIRGDQLHYTIDGYIDMGEAFARTFLNTLSGDSTAPVISNLNPANADPAVEPTANLSLTFNEAVAFGRGTIALRQSGGALVESFDVANPSSGLSLDGDTITIDPSNLFAASTGHYVEIEPGAIRDLAGNSFAGISGDDSWSFTTSAADNSLPGIDSLSPAHGETGVKFDRGLTLEFSENVSFGTGLITLKTSDGTVIESYDVASPPVNLMLSGSRLTIRPGADLQPSTGYYIEIAATAIDDAAGNSFAGISGDGSWSFTTAAALIDGGGITASASNISMGDLAFDFGSGTQAWHPYRTIDGSGLSAGEHSTATHTGWLTKKESIQGAPPPLAESYIQWDLGDNYPLDSIHIWNMNLNGDTGASIRSVDVYYSNIEFPGDPEGEGAANWTKLGGTSLEFPQAPASGNTGFDLATATSTALPSTEVRYIRFELNSNWNGTDSETGISEIQFTAASRGVDTTPPAISLLQPAHTATGVNPASDLSVTFTEDIALGTGEIRLLQSGGALVETFNVASPSSGLTVSGTTLTIHPSSLLAGSTSYYVEIDGTAIEDLLGNSFAGISGDGTWSFTTAAADTSAPAIDTQIPEAGVTGFNPASNLMLVFDEPVALGSGTVALRQSDGTLVESFDVAAADGLTLSGKTLTINPSAELADATGYYIEIDGSAIDDLSGNSFAGISGGSAWSFTTIVPDLTPPGITSITPANGTTDFFPADNLVITFDELVALGSGFIRLRKSDGTVIESFDVANPPANFHFLSDTITINPTEDLPLGTDFYVEIESTAVRDHAGNYYPGTSGSATWGFSVPASVNYTTISHVDTQFDIETGANNPNEGWRNPIPAKPLDIDGDNILGTDGYFTSSRVSHPSYATVSRVSPNINGPYDGKIYDDPNAPSGNDIGYKLLHDPNAGAGEESAPLVQFEITEELPEGTTLRVGILFDHVSNGPNTATYTIRQSFGGTATATTPVHTWTGESMDVAYFDLTDLHPTHRFVVTCTTIDTTYYPGAFEQVLGVTFDTGVDGPDATAPVVSAFDPAHSSGGVSPSANLSVTFNEEVAFGSGVITLRQSGGALIESFDAANPPAGLTLSGETVTLAPTADLAAETSYYVEIDPNAIEDLAGNSFAGFSGESTWSFTTGAVDSTAPSIATLSPSNGASAVSPVTDLVITFDEDVVFGTGHIDLRRDDDGSLVERFDVASPPANLSLSGNTVTMGPSSSFDGSTTYYVEIDGRAIDDLAGNSFAGMLGNGAWSFTSAVVTGGGPITIENPSFEAADQEVGGRGFIQYGNIWAWANDGNESRDLVYLMDNADGSLPWDPTPDGTPQFAFMYNTQGFFQVLTETLAANTTYTLRVDVGDSAEIGFRIPYVNLGYVSANPTEKSDFGMNLLTAATSDTPTPENGPAADDGWVTWTLTFETGDNPAGEGQPLRIDWGGLDATNGEFGVDNFRLEASGVVADTFADWIAGGFTGVGTATGFGDDPDGDGQVNGIENYFGTHPGEFSQGLVAGKMTGNTMTFSHPLNDAPASDITATYRWSKDLSSYHGDGETFDGTTVSFSQGPAENAMVDVTATITGTLLDKLFVLIEVME